MQPPDQTREIRTHVLPHYDGWEGAAVARLAGGLINQTFLLTRPDGGAAVLQRVSAIFSPAIHDNIVAVTGRLREAGLVTPELIPTRDGRVWIAALEGPGSGVWRLLTHIDAVGFDVVGGAAQARSAGALIARFHRALDDLQYTFVGMRAAVHDTPTHLARLEQAVSVHSQHRLATQVAPLARDIAEAATVLPALPALRPRVCHGDLKFNNVLFAGEQALCLIDLDTVGPLSLAYELGDAWRSWCNRAGEDTTTASLDLEVFAASLQGYRADLGRPLSPDERRALLLGVEWVSLELAARFAADALFECYFGWNAERFVGRGEHNLVRARGQWSLFQALRAARADRAVLLEVA